MVLRMNRLGRSQEFHSFRHQDHISLKFRRYHHPNRWHFQVHRHQYQNQLNLARRRDKAHR